MILDHNASNVSRRDALKLGGLTVSLGALVAACGEDRGGDGAAGRVGEAPIVTTPPDYPVDDAVLLRTASSLELTAVEVYEQVLGLEGAVPAALVPVVERLIADHRATADRMAELTEGAGGQAWTCSNPWLMDRLVGPVLEAIQSNVVGIVAEIDGDPELKIQVLGQFAPIADEVIVGDLGTITALTSTSDLELGDEVEFTRLPDAVPLDVIAFATGLENIAAAAHQELAVATGITEARVAHAEAAALEARHAALLAIAGGGAEAYISPALFGEDVAPDARGQIPSFAIPSVFGQTAQIEFKAGPGDVNFVRTSYVLQTPAANSLVYNELSCDA